MTEIQGDHLIATLQDIRDELRQLRALTGQPPYRNLPLPGSEGSLLRVHYEEHAHFFGRCVHLTVLGLLLEPTHEAQPRRVFLPWTSILWIEWDVPRKEGQE